MVNKHGVQHNNPFCYSVARLTIGDADFRLLELLPSSSGDQLLGRIVVAEIEQSSRRFKALSYTWGNGPKSHSILITPLKDSQSKPKTLAITESLHSALVNLRHHRKPVRLWIDQVCIDQEDHTEKGDQVRLMGSIYAAAEQVLVWLGPTVDGSDALMDAWQSVGQTTRDWGLESYYTRERWRLLHPIVENVQPSDPKTAAYQEIMKIAAEIFAPLIRDSVLKHWFARPWFTRAWIVQEFCLCADTVFVCGTKTVTVELVMLAIVTLHNSMGKGELYKSVYAPLNISMALLHDAINEPTARLFSCRQRRRKSDLGAPDSPGDQLHTLLRKLYVEHNTQSTLPRDRIFSLLGLAADTPYLDLSPDYTDQASPAAEARILTLAARAMITNPASGRIDILCFAQPANPHTELTPHLPSWVPDWRGNLRPSFYQINEVTDKHLFAACGPHTSVVPVPTPNASMDVLGLAGYFLDTIESVAPDPVWDYNDTLTKNIDFPQYLTLLRQVDDIFVRALAKDRARGDDDDNGNNSSSSTIPRYYSTQQRRAQARWRVPIADLYWTQGEGMRRAGDEVADLHQEGVEVLELLESLTGLSDEEQGRRMEEWGFHEKLERAKVGGDYRESMKYVVGKRAFLTREGYLGMGPRGAVAGDMVVVFCGGRVPFVLRPVQVEREEGWEEGVFRLVGEAYCDGVMDGEVVEGGELTEFFLV